MVKMKISNFRNLRKLSTNEYVAEVDVEYNRFLFFFVKETRKVFSKSNGGVWRWLDTMEFTPYSVVETLYDVYLITERLKNET